MHKIEEKKLEEKIKGISDIFLTYKYCKKKDDYANYYLYMNIADFKFIIKIYNYKFDFNLWDKYEGITEEVLIENGKGKIEK